MKPEEKIKAVQKHLKERKIDGWLLYDFAQSNPILHIFLSLSKEQICKRRFFYWIPQEGAPVKILHAIETHILDGWPGSVELYSSWQTLHQKLALVLSQAKQVAMEYSPKNEIPYISRVDAGTVELIRSIGPEVVSSGDFLPYFTAVMDEKQIQSHIQAGKALDAIASEVWRWMGEQLKAGKSFSEYDAQQKIIAGYREHHMVSDSPPNVSVNGNTADPHYMPTQARSKPIRKGDFVLIDLWCRRAEEWAVFGDITRVAVAADRPTEEQVNIFSIVRAAQKAATDLVIQRFREKKKVLGYEVDDAARHVIQKAGYGERFLHRTGHNIGVELHGSGAHMDNLEIHDVRPILPGTCFSIEPGIYLEGHFGIRLEYDLYVDLKGEVHIIGGVQDQIVPLLH